MSIRTVLSIFKKQVQGSLVLFRIWDFYEKSLCVYATKDTFAEGATRACQYVCGSLQSAGQTGIGRLRKYVKWAETRLDLFWANEAFTFTWCDPKLLTGLVPYNSHIHGKFYEMTEGMAKNIVFLMVGRLTP